MTAMTEVISQVSSSLIEREDDVAAIVRGIIAREHVLLVGPPGTGKSNMCRLVAQSIANCRYCERLLSPTTPPEALFGPISLSALKEDRYEYVGKNCVTDSEIIFLDEFFRGSDAIRDTLLHLLGPERQALIGSKQVKVPLMCAIGASNTWSDGAYQAAAMDRWLIRREIRPVSMANQEKLLFSQFPDPKPIVSLMDIRKMQRLMDTEVSISQESKEAMLAMLKELHEAGIRPSDRRRRSSVNVAKAEAVIQGSSTVEPEHLECLADVLWDDPREQPAKCREIVARIANPTTHKANGILMEVEQIVAEATDSAKQIAAIKKLQDCSISINKLLNHNGNSTSHKKVQAIANHVRSQLVQMQARALGVNPDVVTSLLK